MKKESATKFIGVDIGGSHITAAEIDLESNLVKDSTRVRERVNSLGTSDDIIQVWQTVLLEIIADCDPDTVKIGFAMPGPFDYQEGISYIKDLNKYESLYGMNIKQIIAGKLGISPKNILFRNDAEAFLHGEVASFDIPETVKVVGITLGTGLGAATSFQGETKDVFRAIVPMHTGISEDYISSRWFMKKYEELCGKPLKDVESLVKGNEVDLRNILFEEFGKNLGDFLNAFIEEENAGVVIIGGNIARCFDLFIDRVKACIVDNQVKIYQSRLWEDAALVGAVYNFSDSFYSTNISKSI